MVPLSELAQVNPRLDKTSIADDDHVSFIPMAAVGAGDARIDVGTVRPFKEVKRGYMPFVEGDVLFAKVTPCMENGKMAIARGLKGGIGFGSSEFHVLRPDENSLDAKYLYHFVSSSSFRKEAARHMTGAVGLRRVPASFLCDAQIPFVDLGVQRRVVAEIEKQFSRLDEAVGSLHRIRANLRRYTAAVLEAAFAGRLVESQAAMARRNREEYESASDLIERVSAARRTSWSGSGRCTEAAAPDVATLATLPEGWKWASMEQISDFITKGTTPAAEKLSNGSGEIHFLKVYNLSFDGQLNDSYKPAFVSKRTHEGELARSRVRPGDVLINIVGPPLGQVSIVPASIKEANINQAIARIRPIAPISSRFVAMTLMCDSIVGWALRRAKTTAGQANLTLELCRDLPIPIPPIAEQTRLVAEVDRRLSIARELEAEVDANLKRAQALRQAILAKAFSGAHA